MNDYPSLKTDIGGLILKNPVMTASGTFGYGSEFKDIMDLNDLGGIIVKGLSLNPSKGNPPPRIYETPCGMLNAIGLENIGIKAFAEKKLGYLRELDTPCFVNIYGKTIEEYAAIAEYVDTVDGIDGIEVNISCPNVSAGGLAFGVDPFAASNVVTAVKARTKKHVMVKLTPNVTDVVTIAKSVENAGADSISLINTLTGMAIDITSRKPVLGNVVGGLSGPAIKPVALRMVFQVASNVNIPVIGIGGIATAADALEFIIAGASAVQIGTVNFVNPSAAIEIRDGIRAYLADNRLDSLDQLIGSVVI
jgi:dihydroorotate dehydrogenase (NAD+) catalytic subunit